MTKKDELKSEDKNKSSAHKNEKGSEAHGDSIEEKLKKSEEKLLRALAETENQRKRFEKEIKDAFDFGGFSFAKETLSLLDNLQRAKISMKNDETLQKNKDLDKFLDNIEILEKDLISIFERNNIKKIDCLKKKFDPNFHQAMMEIEDDNVEPGTVLQEVQPGYTLGERLLRPSFVFVSKKKTQKNEENFEKKRDYCLVVF